MRGRGRNQTRFRPCLRARRGVTGILSLKVAIASGVFLVMLAGGLAYAGLDREFDLPIQATVNVKIVSPAEAAEAADVNGDGKVDGVDLRIVARNLGMTVVEDVRVDVDKNGVVNVLDLAFVGRFLAE